MNVPSPVQVDLGIWSEDFAKRTMEFAQFSDTIYDQCGISSVDTWTWLRDFQACVNNDRPCDYFVILRLTHQCLVYLLSANRETEVDYSLLYHDGYRELLCNIIELVKDKNKDYGSSAFSYPVFVPWIPPQTAILVRLSDKVARIKNLFGKGVSSVPTEAVEDTVRDTVGYLCLLWCLLRTEQLDKAKG